MRNTKLVYSLGLIVLAPLSLYAGVYFTFSVALDLFEDFIFNSGIILESIAILVISLILTYSVFALIWTAITIKRHDKKYGLRLFLTLALPTLLYLYFINV